MAASLYNLDSSPALFHLILPPDALKWSNLHQHLGSGVYTSMIKVHLKHQEFYQRLWTYYIKFSVTQLNFILHSSFLIVMFLTTQLQNVENISLHSPFIISGLDLCTIPAMQPRVRIKIIDITDNCGALANTFEVFSVCFGVIFGLKV